MPVYPNHTRSTLGPACRPDDSRAGRTAMQLDVHTHRARCIPVHGSGKVLKCVRARPVRPVPVVRLYSTRHRYLYPHPTPVTGVQNLAGSFHPYVEHRARAASSSRSRCSRIYHHANTKNTHTHIYKHKNTRIHKHAKAQKHKDKRRDRMHIHNRIV